MNDNYDSYSYDDELEDVCSCSYIPEEIVVPWSSWDGLEASSDDWLDTMLWIKALKGKSNANLSTIF